MAIIDLGEMPPCQSPPPPTRWEQLWTEFDVLLIAIAAATGVTELAVLALVWII